MDPIEAPAGTDAPAVDSQQTTSPPSPAADAATAVTAPAAKDVAREAFDRLAKGEKPDAVNKELYAGQKPAAAERQQASGTGPGKDAQAGDNPTGEQSAAGTEGVTPEDLQVLRRAKFDLGTWKHIPPSNRKAIVATLKATQAEADRQFQQQRSGKAPAAAATATQATTGQQDEATPQADEQDASVDPAQAQARTQTRTTQATPQATAAAAAQQPFGQIDPLQFVDQKDLETLRALGGDELADTHTRGIQRAVGFMQQQMAPMQGLVTALVNQWEESEFNSSLSDLKKEPGFENLTPEQTKQLREKASVLIRAAADPTNYRFREAIPDAAASLFRTNARVAVQAGLLRSRQASLQGSAERGVGRTQQADRAMTPKERNAAIFAKLQEGFSPDEARRAVDSR